MQSIVSNAGEILEPPFMGESPPIGDAVVKMSSGLQSDGVVEMASSAAEIFDCIPFSVFTLTSEDHLRLSDRMVLDLALLLPLLLQPLRFPLEAKKFAHSNGTSEHDRHHVTDVQAEQHQRLPVVHLVVVKKNEQQHDQCDQEEDEIPNDRPSHHFEGLVEHDGRNYDSRHEHAAA